MQLKWWRKNRKLLPSPIPSDYGRKKFTDKLKGRCFNSSHVIISAQIAKTPPSAGGVKGLDTLPRPAQGGVLLLLSLPFLSVCILTLLPSIQCKLSTRLLCKPWSIEGRWALLSKLLESMS
jgi:hypothetical protein